MKKLGNILTLSVSIVLLILSAVLFINARNAVQVMAEQPVLTTVSRVPEFPSTVSLADEKVDLSRFDMYERYDRELTSFCYTHSTTLLMIKRANRIFPIVEPILKKNNVPADFVYLAAIESMLNPRAVSPAGAVGLWQLMPATAREFGLEVNSSVDERYHIEKSTEAACRYLKKAYDIYGNWSTVAASYNAGMGRITSELKKQQTDRSFDLWLNEETSRYVFRILAFKEILSGPYKYGFVIKNHQLYKPIETRGVEVTGSIENIVEFAKKHGITYSILKEFNPWLRGDALPNKTGKKYILKIPSKDDIYYDRSPREPYRKEWVVD